MTIDDVRARLEDGHARMVRMRVGSAQGVDRDDLRALLDDHARLAAEVTDPLWQRAYNEALRHHHEVEAERDSLRAEVERCRRATMEECLVYAESVRARYEPALALSFVISFCETEAGER